MIKLYLLTKQIHRLILYVTVLLIAFMSVTGLILKYPTLSIHYLPFLDLGLIRYIHNEFSLYFIAAVSYTHLDVYKRQHIEGCCWNRLHKIYKDADTSNKSQEPEDKVMCDFFRVVIDKTLFKQQM